MNPSPHTLMAEIAAVAQRPAVLRGTGLLAVLIVVAALALPAASARGQTRGQILDTQPPDVSAPVPVVHDVVGPRSVPITLTWSAKDVSGIREFRLQQRYNGRTSQLQGYSSVTDPRGTTVGSIDLSLAAPGDSYKFAVQAVDNAGNGAWASSGWIGAVDDTDPRIRYAGGSSYSGAWARITAPDYFGGATTRTLAAGDGALLSFFGTYIAWVGTLNPSGGDAQVYLDGALVKTISQNADPPSLRRVLFTERLQPGPHQITIEAVGKGFTDIDTFIVEE